jgi:hypothetical protein
MADRFRCSAARLLSYWRSVMSRTARILTCAAIILLAGLNPAAHAQTAVDTGWMYQGRLTNAGCPATGAYDLRLTLYSNAAGTTAVGPVLLRPSVPLEGGLFTVKLDFGAQFTGSKRWLKLEVKPAGGPTYTALPLQEITSAPQSLLSQVPWSTSSANVFYTGTASAIGLRAGGDVFPFDPQTNRSESMTRLSTLVGLALVLLVPTCPAAADTIPDPVGDFLSTYTGPHDPGLDVVAHSVMLQGDRLIIYGRMAGPIAPTAAIGGLNVIGFDRGQGTPRFLSGTPQIGPNVVWDSIVRINPNGTGLFNNLVAGVVTPLDPADIIIDGNEFTASVPLSVMSPASTRPPCEWTYNLWPRNGLIPGQNQHVSDLAPDDGNSPVQTIPEVACATDMTALWPPNHRMIEVRVLIDAADLCTSPEALGLVVLATSNEPDNARGDGDGNTTGDTHGADGFTAPVDVTDAFEFNPLTGRFEGSVFLRAERAQSGTGRTYTIHVTVLNSHNNSAKSSCDVNVPLNPLR